jgi:excisionase family DNA binding protein
MTGKVMPMAPNDEKLSTFQEILARFKVSESTLRRWVRSGEIEVVYLGRQLRFPESEVKRFLDLRRRARNRQDKRKAS